MNRTQIPKDEFETLALTYLNSRRGEAAASTVRRMSSMKVFAKWAWELPVLTDYKSPEPAETVPHPLPNGIEGVRAMLSVARTADQIALVCLQGYFALRVSEARAVVAIHFNESEQQLCVRGKGSKDRRLDYDVSTMAILLTPYQRSLVDGAPLCRLSDSGARLAIKTLAEKAGIQKDVSSHDLRATCLTELYDRTHDIELVRRFAGHASVKQTQIYIGSRRETLRKAVVFA